MDQKYLNHDNEVFDTMMKNLDIMIERTVGNMIMRNADESTITLKIGVSLDKKSVPDEKGGYRQATQPSFKHDISSVMQVKDKMSGTFKGNVELIFDEVGKPIVRDIDDGQMKIWDEDGNVSVEENVDNDSELRTLPSGKLYLPDVADVNGYYIEVSDEGIDESPTGKTHAENEKYLYDPSPFDYLMKYRNQTMRCQNNSGTYIVRANTDSKIILSSGFAETDTFHIGADMLIPHVGENLVCVTSPENSEDPDAIEIWCDDCGACLFCINNPAHDTKEDDTFYENPEDYEYDSPEA